MKGLIPSRCIHNAVLAPWIICQLEQNGREVFVFPRVGYADGWFCCCEAIPCYRFGLS